MGYCRFQNTLNDLRDCLEAMEDDDLSEEEAKARNSLVRVCIDIVAQADFMGLLDEEE
jgi:hypothetical protein